MKRPEVGDEMVLVKPHYRGGGGGETPVRVTKVARKYFYVAAVDGSSWWLEKAKFSLEDGLEPSYSNYAMRVTTAEQIAAEARRVEVEKELREEGVEFRYGSRRMSTEKLEAILALVRES